MKFGGTSVGTADRIILACSLVKDNLDRQPVIVVSAHNSSKYRMTNTLISSAQRALDGNPDSFEIRQLQEGFCTDLGLSNSLVESMLDEVDAILKGISLVREISKRTMDLLLSFGERMSSRIFTEVLRQRFDVDAVCIPSYELGFRTDSNFGNASFDKDSAGDIKDKVSSVKNDAIVTTGFIGMDHKGDITTLGRGGSDLTATILGAVLNVDEVQIWTDVDGVMTADPGIVKNAKLVPELTFQEAAELAWYGSQVLHPLSMLPAIENNIPVRVLNTYNPDQPGTKICAQLDNPQELVKSVAFMKNITLITITAPQMLGAHGFLERTFGIFAKYKMDIHMIATAEISFSLTIPGGDDENLELAAGELRQFAEVEIEKNKAVVCVIGEQMYGTIGVGARILGAVGNAGVEIRMISMEAHEYNVSLLVDEDDVETAVKALHAEFFEKD